MEDNNQNKRTTRFTRNKTEDISNLLYGKIPPQARELEEAVLGALLIEGHCIEEIIDILKPESFYIDAHATIFRSILSLYERSNPIDLLTVTEDLRRMAKLEETGGAYYLSELTNKIASSANIVYHSRIIVQKFIAREMIRISNDVIRDSYEDTTDVFDLLDTANDKFLSLNNTKPVTVKSVAEIEASIKRSIIEKKPLAKSYKLGLENLDFLSKTFNLIGGYNGTGKTAAMCSISKNLTSQGFKVGIFSIEMSAEMLVARMMQEQNSISAKKMLTDGLSEEEKEMIFNQNKLSDNIFVDASTDLTNKNINLRAKSFILKYDLDFLWIDFMQMIGMEDSKKLEVRENEIMTKGLQNTAKDLDKCIVGLVQLNSTVNNEKPTYKNIRNGGLSDAASDIILLYDEYFKDYDGWKWNDIPINNRGKIKGIYAKGRYTGVGNIDLYFNKPKQLMCAWNDKPYESMLSEMQEEKQPQELKF